MSIAETGQRQKPRAFTTSATANRDFRGCVAEVVRLPRREGRPVRDARTLDRIRSLVIPPAWTDVWICARADGHLQATGRDARGRKQHRYHPEWTRARNGAKYDRMVEFALALPAIRKRVQRRSEEAAALARACAGRRRDAAREDADPDRQQGVRASQQVVRAHDAARRARADQRPHR